MTEPCCAATAGALGRAQAAAGRGPPSRRAGPPPPCSEADTNFPHKDYTSGEGSLDLAAIDAELAADRSARAGAPLPPILAPLTPCHSNRTGVGAAGRHPGRAAGAPQRSAAQAAARERRQKQSVQRAQACNTASFLGTCRGAVRPLPEQSSPPFLQIIKRTA